MARDKKTMIGFDPLAWLDNESTASSASEDNARDTGVLVEKQRKVKAKPKTAVKAKPKSKEKAKAKAKKSAKAIETQVDHKLADSSNVQQENNALVTSVKIIDVLGVELDETALLQGYELVIDDLCEVSENFYDDLFEQHPEVKPLFKSTNVQLQSSKLISAIKLLVGNLHNKKNLKNVLSDLGVQHQKYGALPEHYSIVATLLVNSCKTTVGNAWSPAINEAWLLLLKAAAGAMCNAYELVIENNADGDLQKESTSEVEKNQADNDEMSRSPQSVLQLHSIQDIGKSQMLKNDMLELINNNDEINIEASTVERIDGSALQLLCALFQYSKNNNLAIHWLNPTQAILDSASTLGIKQMLELN